MNVFVALLVIAASAGLAISALLLVRRHAPDGSYFHDGDRAAGVFGVLATGFAVLLGLVVVLAFTSYDESRAGAEAEALTLAQQYEVAQLLPSGAGRRLASVRRCSAAMPAIMASERLGMGPWACSTGRGWPSLSAAFTSTQ